MVANAITDCSRATVIAGRRKAESMAGTSLVRVAFLVVAAIGVVGCGGGSTKSATTSTNATSTTTSTTTVATSSTQAVVGQKIPVSRFAVPFTVTKPDGWTINDYEHPDEVFELTADASGLRAVGLSFPGSDSPPHMVEV